jgi:hypothetical protein
MAVMMVGDGDYSDFRGGGDSVLKAVVDVVMADEAFMTSVVTVLY